MFLKPNVRPVAMKHFCAHESPRDLIKVQWVRLSDMAQTTGEEAQDGISNKHSGHGEVPDPHVH